MWPSLSLFMNYIHFCYHVFFLGYLSQHVLSVYTRVSVDMKKKRKLSTSVVVSGRSIEVIALQSVIS